MPDKDWELGQSLIERGFCTLDQVREALSIQDRMKAMGIVPKTLPEVLLEKRYVSADQLRAAGIPVRAAAPPPAPPKPARRGTLPSRKRRLAPWFALVALASVLFALLFFGGDLLRALQPAREARPRRVEPEGPSESEKADQAAKEALDRIVAFQGTSNDFENAGEVVQRYLDYMKKHAGDKWEIESNRRLQEYTGKAESFARPKLDEILKEEPSLREQGRTEELLRRLRAFPPRFLLSTESGRVVREKLAELSQRQREGVLQGKAEAEKLLAEKKFEAALERLAALRLLAPQESLEDLGNLQTRIEFEQRAVAQRNRQEVADLYYKVDGAFKEALARKPSDPREAANAVGEFLFAPRALEQQPFVRTREVDYNALKKAIDEWKPEAILAICEAAVPDAAAPDQLSTAETALLALRNAALLGIFYRDLAAMYRKAVDAREPLDLPSLGRGRFERKGERTVYLAEAKGEVDPAKNPLSDPDRAYLAMRVGPEDPMMNARVGFFFYYAASAPDYERAYAHLMAAHKGKVKAILPFLADLTRATEMELSRLLRIKFESAVELFKKGQKVQARTLLEEVRKYQDHPYVQEKRAELEKMLFEIVEGTERERKLALAYRGKGEALEDGRARITYDFSSKEQLEAFDFAVAKVKGRWKLERAGLESTFEPSAVSWKTPVKGDVRLEYDLGLIDEAQNIVVDLYYNKGSSRHYALVFGFDWVGKADGDPHNTAEDRFGMPRTCVIKYPVSVDKSRWVLPQEWENWTRRLVGGPKVEFRPAKGKSYRIEIVRQGKILRMIADRRTVWEGEDDAYTEGQILFFSDSRCRITNLSITFRPQ